jgi:hypothetical protein
MDKTQKTIFKIDNTGNTTFFNTEDKEIQIGKFGYNNTYLVVFQFTEELNKQTIDSGCKGFIEAEQFVVKKINI